jgi:hypothetical protein
VALKEGLEPDGIFTSRMVGDSIATMGNQGTSAGIPVTELPDLNGEDHSICPDCEHRREVEPTDWIDRLVSAWRRRHPLPEGQVRAVAPAECPWRFETMADPCGCVHSFHAS